MGRLPTGVAACLQMPCRSACATGCMLPPMSRGAASRYGATAPMPLVRKVGWSFLRRMLSHHPLPRQLPLEPRRTFSIQGASRGSRTTLPRLSLAVDSLVQRLSLRSAALHSAEYQQPHGQGCSYLPAWSWLRQHTGCTEPQAEYIPLLG